MTDERQIVAVPSNQISTKRGFPVYRTNPSVPNSKGLPTRSRRFEVPGGKAAMIVDNSTGEIKGLGGMGFWWEEEVDTTRFMSNGDRLAFVKSYHLKDANRQAELPLAEVPALSAPRE